MKFECLTKENLKLMINNWIEDIKNNEKLSIEIKKCPILKGTFDFEIRRRLKNNTFPLPKGRGIQEIR